MRVSQPRTKQDFAAYYQLRWEVLRAPWRQPVGSERDDLEDAAYHLVAQSEAGELLGVARLHWNSSEQAQIRYMAVREASRNQGVGKLLLDALEQEARRRGAREIILHARESVTGFYRANGYELVSPSHILFGEIQHYFMKKNLVR